MIKKLVLIGSLVLLLTASGSVATGISLTSSTTNSPGGVPSISPIADFMGGSGSTSFENYLVLEQNEVSACMQSKGLFYIGAVPSTSVSSTPTNPQAATAYAKQYGYGLLNHPISNPATDGKNLAIQEGNYMHTLAPNALSHYVTALGTCQHQAQAVTQKSFPVFNRSLNTQIAKDQQAEWSAPSYIAAESQWSSCMAQKGFSFKTPNAARASFNADVKRTALNRKPRQGSDK